MNPTSCYWANEKPVWAWAGAGDVAKNNAQFI